LALKCPNPECDADVPPPGLAAQTGTSGEGDAIALQGLREYADCPNCGWKLVRNPDAPDPKWQRAEPA
jgi:hypothetical protein